MHLPVHYQHCGTLEGVIITMAVLEDLWKLWKYCPISFDIKIPSRPNSFNCNKSLSSFRIVFQNNYSSSWDRLFKMDGMTNTNMAHLLPIRIVCNTTLHYF